MQPLVPYPMLHRQRGAVGLFGMLVLLLTLGFAVLVLDTGRLALEKRRLQQIADLAAIDAVQQAGICSGTASMDGPTVRAAAQQSAGRNGYSGDLSGEANAVLLGSVTTGANGVRQFASTVEAAASAVQVTARKEVLRSFVAGGWYGGTVSLQATGVAQRSPHAGFWVGSFLASVDSEQAAVLNEVLGQMLGSAIHIDAASYEGLLNADITVAQLIAGAELAGVSLQANTVAGLLASEVTVGDFLSIMATALGAGGDAAAVAIGEIAAAAVALDTLIVGDLLRVTTDDPDSTRDVAINAYALGTAAIQLAREGETFNGQLATALPLGVALVDLSWHITEAPSLAIGPPGQDENGAWKTAASTAQVQLQIDISVSDAPLFPVGLDVVSATLDIPIAVQAARADAWLAGIRCASAAQPVHRIDVGVAPSAVGVALGRFDDMNDPGSLLTGASADIHLLGSSIASATISQETEIGPASAEELQYEVRLIDDDPPMFDLPQRETVGSPLAASLDGATQSLLSSVEPHVELGGMPAPGVSASDIEEALTSEVFAEVLPVLDEVVLEPLLRAMGIYFGGADVQVVSLSRDEARLAR